MGGASMILAAGALIGAVPAAAAGAVLKGHFPIVELRQYTLHDDQRDTLINLFEREFIESQEALGMKVIGTFRDLDRPNRFVWLRGFTDMDSRKAGLTAFYSGALWLSHRDQANATIIDNDNVLLLRAPERASEFHLMGKRPALGQRSRSGLVVATVYYLKGSLPQAARLFEQRVKPRLDRHGVHPLAWFVTEEAANNFRLPVREGEKVLVWFARFFDPADHRRHQPTLDAAEASLKPLLAKSPEVLRLEPTQRSELR